MRKNGVILILLCCLCACLCACDNTETPAETPAQNGEIEMEVTAILAKAVGCKPDDIAFSAKLLGSTNLGQLVKAELIKGPISTYTVLTENDAGEKFVFHISKKYMVEAIQKDSLDGDFILKIIQ